MKRGKLVTPTLTERQLDILAHWWYAHGSATRAAEKLKIKPQPVRNALYLMRKQERIPTNFELAFRYMDLIEKRRRKVLRRVA